jgi:hypothetical protein
MGRRSVVSVLGSAQRTWHAAQKLSYLGYARRRRAAMADEDNELTIVDSRVNSLQAKRRRGS